MKKHNYLIIQSTFTTFHWSTIDYVILIVYVVFIFIWHIVKISFHRYWFELIVISIYSTSVMYLLPSMIFRSRAIIKYFFLSTCIFFHFFFFFLENLCLLESWFWTLKCKFFFLKAYFVKHKETSCVINDSFCSVYRSSNCFVVHQNKCNDELGVGMKPMK